MDIRVTIGVTAETADLARELIAALERCARPTAVGAAVPAPAWESATESDTAAAKELAVPDAAAPGLPTAPAAERTSPPPAFSRDQALARAIETAREAGGGWTHVARLAAAAGFTITRVGLIGWAKRRGIAPPKAHSPERLQFLRATAARLQAVNAARRRAEEPARKMEEPARRAEEPARRVDDGAPEVILATREQIAQWAAPRGLADFPLDLEKVNRKRRELGLPPFLLTRTAVLAA